MREFAASTRRRVTVFSVAGALALLSSCGGSLSGTDDDGTLPSAPVLPPVVEVAGPAEQVTLPGIGGTPAGSDAPTDPPATDPAPTDPPSTDAPTDPPSTAAPSTEPAPTDPPADPSPPTTVGSDPTLPALPEADLDPALLRAAKVGDGWQDISWHASPDALVSFCTPTLFRSQTVVVNAIELEGSDVPAIISHQVLSYESASSAGVAIELASVAATGCASEITINDIEYVVKAKERPVRSELPGACAGLSVEYSLKAKKNDGASLVFIDFTIQCGRFASWVATFTRAPGFPVDIQGRVEAASVELLTALPGAL